MRIVLLSGGTGKRLWPLSNGYRSKQYLSLLDGPEGEPESMVQRLWRQLAEADLQEYALFSACIEQVSLLKEQLGDKIPIIAEPEQRDTFAAAALSCVYLYSIAGVSLNETIIIVPSDVYVESDFYQCIRSLPKLLRESGSKLLMVGMKPVWSSEHCGYILPEDYLLSEEAMLLDSRVRSFKERPTEQEAKWLTAQGALWNSGVYAFRLEYLIHMLVESGYPVHYGELYALYGKLRRSSFERAVIQQEASISVVRYDGLWKDLGSWKLFTDSLILHRAGTYERR